MTKKTFIMQKLFDIMMEGEEARFTPEGKKALKDKNAKSWHFISINVDNTVDICSNNHHIYKNCYTSWFSW